MIIYRCKWDKLPDTLNPSKKAGRWNYEGDKVIYCSESRSLAAFEVLVHMKDNWILNFYTFLGIDIPPSTIIALDPIGNPSILEPNLKKPIDLRDSGDLLQKMGHDWYRSNQSLVLKVPSVIIPKEFNFMINTEHPDFKKVKIKSIEPFYKFDSRLKD